MKIAVLCDVRWYNACAWNAVELAEALGRLGHEVVFAARSDSPPARRALERGIEVVEIAIERSGPIRLARGVRSLAALARERGIEVFDAHRSEGFLAAVAAARLVDRPIGVVRTRTDIRAPKGHLLNRLLHRRGAHAISAAGQFMYADFAAIGVDGERIRVVHPGVVVDRFVPGQARAEADDLRARLGAGTGPVVGLVGRLTAVKGHSVFIDAAAILSRRWPTARFVVSGEEWDVKREDLRARAEAAGIADRVDFLDRLPDVRPLLEALDVVVVASTGSEAVSRIALEAMALARPVVATRVGSLPELLEGDVGVLVAPGDPEALAEGIGSVLAEPDDAMELGWRGRRRLEEHFSREEAVRATVDLYQEALRRAGATI